VRVIALKTALLSLWLGCAYTSAWAVANADAPVTVAPVVQFGDILSVVNLSWGIIKDNTLPNVVTLPIADALPPGAKNWSSLDHWKSLVTFPFHYSFRDRLGVEVIQFDYEIVFLPGGEFNGEGQYISNLQVVALNTRVAWGYHLTATVTTGEPINFGSQLDPLAVIPVQMSISGSDDFRAWQGTRQYLIYGDGRLVELPAIPVTGRPRGAEKSPEKQ